MLASGYAGTWLYGLIERALIPFGLQHVFYMPFWQTEIGGSMVIDGNLVQCAQNIFFAELASKSTEHFSVSATRFMSGKFPFMITKFNLKTPGREADDEETKLYTRKDMDAKKAGKSGTDTVSAMILKGLGGKDNISDIDCWLQGFV